ncbi:sensor histidine kinase [Desertivirga brevis]|uniref:sensor histidine kinase n=1 Tax=Desertivirga brevis TaxID=2810310 RepID=UPI001A96614F|nr:histidine kinase [Pedobacter sp. SYSU D00873]
MAIKNQQFNKYLTPLGHILFWMLLLFLPHMVRISSTGVRFSDSVQNRLIIGNLFLIAFFYINVYIFYPLIYKRKGLILYVVVLAVTVFLFVRTSFMIERTYFRVKPTEIENLTNKKPAPPNQEKARKRRHKEGYFYFLLFPYIFIIGVSISYRIIRDSSRAEKSLKEKENENLKTELSFLRSQVSPHFMFNVLNTLVAMARKKSDLMEPSLIKLSHMMRYMLYESNDEKISLDKEVEYLRNYIDLQLLRFGDDLLLELDIADSYDDYEIEPMLLISFIENAFKHGIGMVDDPFIKIKLAVNQATNWLEFKVENSVSPQDSARDKASGIGLNNMRRRLELLYKDRYKLETVLNGTTFVSKLNIQLK